MERYIAQLGSLVDIHIKLCSHEVWHSTCRLAPINLNFFFIVDLYIAIDGLFRHCKFVLDGDYKEMKQKTGEGKPMKIIRTGSSNKWHWSSHIRWGTKQFLCATWFCQIETFKKKKNSLIRVDLLLYLIHQTPPKIKSKNSWEHRYD